VPFDGGLQVARKVAAVEARLKKMDDKTETQQTEERLLKQQADEKRTEESKLKAALAEVSKGQEKLTNKRSMAMQKRDNNLKKIQVRRTLFSQNGHQLY
jgi:predicted RNase H-like nuclease (RuvC/YqgF family)